ncbi:MAG: GIY-YIG nuclease family protein [Chloroflexi bacterium]|nr:GIY-YIG nuclease family protein [Chloroflexota bacterium]
MRDYFVYIITNHSGTLYTGVTSDLTRRVYEHKTQAGGSFTKKYRMNKLLYFEQTGDILSAIEREKQIKGWRRSRKLELITSQNPRWIDLAREGLN